MRRVRGILLALFLTGLAGSSEGAVVFDLNARIDPTNPDPAGTGPWLRATFEDVGGGVQLTLESLLQSTSEFVQGNINDKNVSSSSFGWGFNFDPNLDVSKLVFSFQSGTEASGIALLANAFKADGDGYFDILLGWDKKDGGRFDGTDTAVYLITSSETISENSFDFSSAPGGGNGTWKSAAHVQGLADGASTWIGPGGTAVVPEPASVAVWSLLGVVGIALSWLRKRRAA